MMASLPHYAEHILPVFNALPDNMRGRRLVDRPSWRGDRTVADITLVAGMIDIQTMDRCPVVMIEHGAGQTYSDLPGSPYYGGGKHPPHVLGYISPSDRIANLWRRPSVAVGCPKLDRFLPDPPPAEPRTLAVTWRWDAPIGEICPENRSALPHYRARMNEVIQHWQAEGWEVLGHGHPRSRDTHDGFWRAHGIIPTWDANEILARSALVIGDNSSLLYEAAALGRKVLCLNAPWYRRDIEHGMRFWSAPPGGMVDDPDQLLDLDITRYVEEDWTRGRREHAVSEAYKFLDGHSAERAAAFVVSLLGGQADHRGARTVARPS